MTRGAYRAGSPRHSADRDGDVATESPAMNVIAMPADADDSQPPVAAMTTRERVALWLFATAALCWIAVLGGVALSTIGNGGLGIVDLMRGVSIASGPLALIATVLILWQRSGRREAARYADVARGVRLETLALDAVLGLVAQRLGEDRAAVATQADQLLALADETSARLATATAALGREVAELGRRSRELDEAAGTARVDMGVLLADLPIAERQVRALAEDLRGAGLGAHEQAAALQTLLAALAARAREAEDNAGGAANRMQAQVSRIAGASEIAARDIDAAADRMGAAIDDALGRAGDAVERTHQGIVAQGDAIAAMAERARAAADAASSDVAVTLENRVAAISATADSLAALLARQDDVGALVIERLQRGLAALEARFAELDESGRARTERLGEALGLLLAHAERTMASLTDGGTAATTLINRTETLRQAIGACLVELDQTLPGALAGLENAAQRSHDAIARSTPEVERLGGIAADAARALDGARGEIDARRDAIEAIGDLIATRIAAVRADAESLGDTIDTAGAKADKLADSTSPKLVEALIRVRETAGQAAERAREALGAIVPQSATALGEAGRKALLAAVGDTVEAQIARVAALSEAAVEAARTAALRLETQLARVAETSASVEDHVAAGKAEVEASDRDNFARRTALLVDSLNSTAIDVAKLLSNEASDAEWEAYLRGDRGAFTRRAVRLLDKGEAREIARHYADEPEFRAQVNRYVHDFEALLRPVLATRDGSTLAVILLSSEMGKLYVALAQAIERLRS